MNHLGGIGCELDYVEWLQGPCLWFTRVSHLWMVTQVSEELINFFI